MHVADGFAARLQDQLNLADSEEIKDDQAYLDKVCAGLQKEGFRAKAILVQAKSRRTVFYPSLKMKDAILLPWRRTGISL